MDLRIEYVPLEEIKPYAGNAKLHPAEQIEQIKNSIREFGFDDPIAVWNGEIVEGHGRFIAANELGIDTVPIIRLDHLTDEQRKAYNIAHNKLTMNSGFNLDLLRLELDSLELDMSDFGFTEAELLELTVDDTPEVIPNREEIKSWEYPNGISDNGGDEYHPGNPATPYGLEPVTKEDLDAYEQSAEATVTKRIIIVYRTDEEEVFLKNLLHIPEDKNTRVVYSVDDIKEMTEGK